MSVESTDPGMTVAVILSSFIQSYVVICTSSPGSLMYIKISHT